MTDPQADGGPAFPTENAPGESSYGYPTMVRSAGMSLRDYFAAHALHGLIASNDEDAGDRITDLPAYAYQIADAMIAERAK